MELEFLRPSVCSKCGARCWAVPRVCQNRLCEGFGEPIGTEFDPALTLQPIAQTESPRRAFQCSIWHLSVAILLSAPALALFRFFGVQVAALVTGSLAVVIASTAISAPGWTPPIKATIANYMLWRLGMCCKVWSRGLDPIGDRLCVAALMIGCLLVPVSLIYSAWRRYRLPARQRNLSTPIALLAVMLIIIEIF